MRASIYPLTATFTPQPPLTRPLEATTPLDLASRALGTLAKLTSVTEITATSAVRYLNQHLWCLRNGCCNFLFQGAYSFGWTPLLYLPRSLTIQSVQMEWAFSNPPTT